MFKSIFWSVWFPNFPISFTYFFLHMFLRVLHIRWAILLVVHYFPSPWFWFFPLLWFFSYSFINPLIGFLPCILLNLLLPWDSLSNNWYNWIDDFSLGYVTYIFKCLFMSTNSIPIWWWYSCRCLNRHIWRCSRAFFLMFKFRLRGDVWCSNLMRVNEHGFSNVNKHFRWSWILNVIFIFRLGGGYMLFKPDELKLRFTFWCTFITILVMFIFECHVQIYIRCAGMCVVQIWW